jgi:hypothetical protein
MMWRLLAATGMRGGEALTFAGATLIWTVAGSRSVAVSAW